MMAAIPQWFAASRHSCFLYLASELVKVFGDVPRYEGALGESAIWPRPNDSQVHSRPLQCLRVILGSLLGRSTKLGPALPFLGTYKC